MLTAGTVTQHHNCKIYIFTFSSFQLVCHKFKRKPGLIFFREKCLVEIGTPGMGISPPMYLPKAWSFSQKRIFYNRCMTVWICGKNVVLVTNLLAPFIGGIKKSKSCVKTSSSPIKTKIKLHGNIRFYSVFWSTNKLKYNKLNFCEN